MCKTIIIIVLPNARQKKVIIGFTKRKNKYNSNNKNNK